MRLTPRLESRIWSCWPEARWEIARSVARSRGETPPKRRTTGDAVLAYLNDKALPIYDPFCGGGSIPLEAQRLGLRAVGSDLNPVAVLITKALIELPHQFANQPPVNPNADKTGVPVGKGQESTRSSPGAAARAGRRHPILRALDAGKGMGAHRSPLPHGQTPDGGEATVIAWLWARTVPAPIQPAVIAMPLIKTFQLSTKNGNRNWTQAHVVDSEEKRKLFHSVQGTA